MDGMSTEQELANRSKGVNFITQVGILLKLPQLTLATASVYLHRFFMRNSMVDLHGRPGLHHYAVAATALFLATKVEENCRKMKELVVACCRVAQKQPNLVVDEQNKEYWKWRDTILHNEDQLLETLCFDLQLEQPYRYLYDFLCYYAVQQDKNLRNVSWAYINDSNLTTMCLLFPARVVAGSALYAALKFTGVSLPDDEQGRPWWDHLGMEAKDMLEAVTLMSNTWENQVLPREGQKEVYAKARENGPDVTRMAASPAIAVSPRSTGGDSQGIKRERDDEESWGAAVENGTMSPKREVKEEPLENGDDMSRSPKRPRISELTDSNGHPQRVPDLRDPAIHRERSNSSREVDDVQARIDNIVNSAQSAQNSTYSHPSLSRRTSQRQQGAQGSQDRRRSHSRSNRPGSPSQQNRYPNHDRQARSSSRSRTGYDRRPPSRQSDHTQIREAVSRQPSQDSCQGQRQADAGYDDGVEYQNDASHRSGSEEGEL